MHVEELRAKAIEKIKQMQMRHDQAAEMRKSAGLQQTAEAQQAPMAAE